MIDNEIKCNFCGIVVKKKETEKMYGLGDICYYCIYKMKLFQII